jgi:phage host-nuclease inhibitor protein Gam
MATKKQKTPPTTITTREELENRVGDYARLSIRRAKLGAIMAQKIDEIRANYDASFADLDDSLSEAFADLEAWAALHPDQFAGKKSLDLVHGIIGLRTNPPSLKTIKGVRWDDVLTLLRQHPGYVRTIQEPDKEAILADRDGLGDAGLAALGLRIDQAEKFYINPKVEEAVVSVL